jgi:hypothetical protein
MGLKLEAPDSENAFHWMKVILLTPAFYAFIQLVLYWTCFKMRTPKYLISIEEYDEAKEVLNKLYTKESAI